MSKAGTDGGEDPIAFLNAMRQRTAMLLGQLDTDHECDLSDLGKAVSKDDDAANNSACAKADSDSHVSPPENLSPEEEVEWWKSRIAQLSGPVAAASDAKGDDAKASESGFKSYKGSK